MSSILPTRIYMKFDEVVRNKISNEIMIVLQCHSVYDALGTDTEPEVFEVNNEEENIVNMRRRRKKTKIVLHF